MGLVLGLTIGGIVLLTGIGVGCYFIFRSVAGTSDDTPAQVEGGGNPLVVPMPPNGGGWPGNRPRNGGWPNNGFNGAPSKITRENYARVQVGMTEAQLHGILGPPTATHDNFGGPNRKALHYTGIGAGGIIIVNNGVVESK